MRFPHTLMLIFRICYSAPTDAPLENGALIISNSSYSSDQASVVVNASLGNPPDIQCDGKSFGFNPSIADCMTAIQYFLPSRAQTTYAQRGTPAQRGSIFPLPLRIMGGTN